MAQRTSQEVVDGGSRLTSGTVWLDLPPAARRGGATRPATAKSRSRKGGPSSTLSGPTPPARLIRATRSTSHHVCGLEQPPARDAISAVVGAGAPPSVVNASMPAIAVTICDHPLSYIQNRRLRPMSD